jgi:hypothetical protein
MRVRRREVVDEYVEGDRVVLYTEALDVVALSELGSAAWAAIGSDWTDAAQVGESLEEAFGAPPDGLLDEAVSRVLDQLRAQGLVDFAQVAPMAENSPDLL